MRVASALAGRGHQDMAWPLGAAALALVLAFALSRQPMMTMGVTLGVAVFLLALVRPLAVVAVMLVIGAVDLSFITGGRQLEGVGGIDMNGMRLIAMMLAMTAIVMVDRRALRQVLGPRARWYVLFLAYGAATLAFSIVPLEGARLLLKLAYPLLLFLAVMAVVRDRSDLERLADWTLVGGLAMALVVIPALLLMGHYEFDLAGRLKSPGVGLHQNPLSFYMLLMALIAVGRFAVRGQRRYLAAAGIFAVWLVASFTRITLLATVNALLVMALFAAWRQRDFRIPLAAGALILGIGVVMVPITLERTFGTVPSVEELVYLAQNPVLLYDRMNLQGREIIWPVVGQVFLDNPVFGRGLGTSTAYVVATMDGGAGGVVHNEYLRLAADTGLVGLILFTMAMFSWLAVAARSGRLTGPVREYAVPAGAGIVVWATVAITDNPFDYYASFTQYIGFLVAAALWLSTNRDGEETDAGPAGEPSADEPPVAASAGRV